MRQAFRFLPNEMSPLGASFLNTFQKGVDVGFNNAAASSFSLIYVLADESDKFASSLALIVERPGLD